MESADTAVRRLRPANPVPLVVLAVLALLQVISPADAWSWSLAGLGSLVVLSYVWARMLRDRVTCTREVLGSWVVAGDVLQERFTLTNRGLLPVVWARVCDHSEVPGYSAERVEMADSGGCRTWMYTGVCQRRGLFHLGPWDLQMADPFGFFEVIHSHPTVSSLTVYPRASFLPHLELPRGAASSSAARAERADAETITVAEIRDYYPGDSLRRVSWPATAHHDRLLVREFDREPTGDVWVIVDMDAGVQAGADADATQEYAVTLAASFASQVLRSGERRGVGLLVSGHRPALLPPGRGQAQLWQIFRALAEAEPERKDQEGPASSRPLAAVLKELGASLGSGRTLVIITPSQDPAWVGELLPLMARANAPTIMLLDATTFTPSCGTPEAVAGIRSLLAEQRIPVYVMAQGFPFRPVERIRRHRRTLQTLAGTGRVIERDIEEEV